MLLSASAVLAADTQSTASEGDAQTCIGDSLSCGLLEGVSNSPTGEGTAALNLTIATAQREYTTNELVTLSAAPPEWWNSAWQYRIAINMTSNAAARQHNIQASIVLDTATLIAAGKMRSDCADIRIISKSLQLMEYDIFTCNSGTTTINVSAPHLRTDYPLMLWVYTGKPSATDASTTLTVPGTAVDPDVVLGTIEQYRTNGALNNTGTANATGQLRITVEPPVGAAIVLSNTTQSIAPSSTLDVNTLMGAWNTTLANEGTYLVRTTFVDTLSATLLNVTAPFGIIDTLHNLSIDGLNGHVLTSTNPTIWFTSSSPRSVTDCVVLRNGGVIVSTSNVDDAGVGNATITLPVGVSNVTISCNVTGGINANATRRFVVINSSFSGTNLTNITSLSNITNLTLSKPAGTILFTSPVDLSSGADLEPYVHVSSKNITIDTTQLPNLNQSARLTFADVTDIAHPVVLVDGVVCNSCTIVSFGGGALVVDVLHFSSYTVAPNAQLYVSDTTDLMPAFALEQVTITANYSNTTSSAPIAGAVCNVTFNDTSALAMTYASGLFTYNRTFPAPGVYTYLVSCSAAGFESLNVSDYVSIRADDGPVGPTNLTVVGTSRANYTIDPGTSDSRGGNTTEINLVSNQLSTSWQGVHGNLSGEIVLQTGDEQRFYNWSIGNITGQIYASRAADVNFATVDCADDSIVAQEDTYLGIVGSSEAVNNTFLNQSHPSFRTGRVNHTTNSCKSTNLLVSGATDPTKFYQVVLADGANNTVYTALLQTDTPGFNGRPTDFQMLIPTRKDVVEVYYYWVQIT